MFTSQRCLNRLAIFRSCAKFAPFFSLWIFLNRCMQCTAGGERKRKKESLDFAWEFISSRTPSQFFTPGKIFQPKSFYSYSFCGRKSGLLKPFSSCILMDRQIYRRRLIFCHPNSRKIINSFHVDLVHRYIRTQCRYGKAGRNDFLIFGDRRRRRR